MFALQRSVTAVPTIQASPDLFDGVITELSSIISPNLGFSGSLYQELPLTPTQLEATVQIAWPIPPQGDAPLELESPYRDQYCM